MTYVMYLYNGALGPSFPVSNATFPGYASTPDAGSPGWYLVGVGENQNFHAEALGYHPGPVTNSDQVDPSQYYFYFPLQPIGRAQPEPPRKLLEKAAKHHANPSEDLPD